MHESKGELIRELGLKEGLAIGLGTMIGAGIFVLLAIAVERAGQAAALSVPVQRIHLGRGNPWRLPSLGSGLASNCPVLGQVRASLTST